MPKERDIISFLVALFVVVLLTGCAALPLQQAVLPPGKRCGPGFTVNFPATVKLGEHPLYEVCDDLVIKAMEDMAYDLAKKGLDRAADRFCSEKCPGIEKCTHVYSLITATYSTSEEVLSDGLKMCYLTCILSARGGCICK